MTCDQCEHVVEQSDVPHIIKTCPGCGRELHVVVRGEDGRGLRVEAGERISIPAGWMQVSPNPLKGNMHLTRAGLESIASTFLIEDLHRAPDAFLDAVAVFEARLDQMVNAFPPLDGLDINKGSDLDRIVEIMQDHKAAPEFWAMWSSIFLAMSREAISEGNAERAAWATACAERFRSMMVFKESLEDVAWMGQSVRRVIELLGIWDTRQDESDEEFWQRTFMENSYALSQIFAVPMVFIQDKAYVGGMALDRSDARFVDYLYSTESSRDAVLIEIKTPTTRLQSSKYRGNLPPSRDLSGSVVQVLNYRAELVRNLDKLASGVEGGIAAFSPRCAIIIGNATNELRDNASRRAFELFRTSLKDVEIVTYDELFRKVEILAELFGLKRHAQEQPG